MARSLVQLEIMHILLPLFTALSMTDSIGNFSNKNPRIRSTRNITDLVSMTTVHPADVTQFLSRSTVKRSFPGHDKKCNSSADAKSHEESNKEYFSVPMTTNLSKEVITYQQSSSKEIEDDASGYTTTPLFAIAAILGTIAGSISCYCCIRRRKLPEYQVEDRAAKRFCKKHMSKYKTDQSKERTTGIKILVSRPSLTSKTIEDIDQISFVNGSGDYENVKAKKPFCIYKVMSLTETPNRAKDTPSLDGSVFLYDTPLTNPSLSSQRHSSSVSSTGPMFLAIPTNSADLQSKVSYLSLRPIIESDKKSRKSTERTASVATIVTVQEEQA